MLRASVGLGLLAGALIAAAPSCIATGPDIQRQSDDGSGGFGGDDAGPAGGGVDAPNVEPHSVVGTTPSHGPFNGGQRVLVRGTGFSSEVKVWFGDTPALEVVPIDATRIQVAAPPGKAGPVDVTAQNGDDASTKRTLPGGYSYDALYAEPSSGPISGGTEVIFRGQGTNWDETTEAFVDEKPCTSLSAISASELSCVVPQGTPGAKTVRVTHGSDTITVLEGYTYEDSSDGYKGGLSGSTLDGNLRVLVYNSFTGDPVPGANVIVGSDIDTAIVRQVGATGVVEIVDPSLDAPRTVTVAALCHSPISFVDVPVDTVTVYLDPILSPACGASGDPPGVGGKTANYGFVEGELVWPQGPEFKRGPWQVPGPLGSEAVVAYILPTTSNPNATFTLPQATSAVTPAADGTIGYRFFFGAAPGNRTYYALAGLEDRSKSPPRFVPYAMGLVRGVSVATEQTTTEVYIPMQNLLDSALTIDPSPPGVGPKGPDRLLTNVAIRLSNDGFALLPQGQKSPFLPLNDTVDFVGVPLLDGPLYGASYFVSARAATGASFTAPMSVVGSVQASSPASPVAVDGFVGVPNLITPALNTPWDGRTLETTFQQGAAAIDLTVYDIAAQNGLHRWTVAVPGGARAIALPDLSGFEGAHLPSGSLVIGIYGAQIDNFDYRELRYRNLRPNGMTAYSLDYVNAILP